MTLLRSVCSQLPWRIASHCDAHAFFYCSGPSWGRHSVHDQQSRATGTPLTMHMQPGE